MSDRKSDPKIANSSGYGKFYKGKKSKSDTPSLPKGMKKNPGKRSADDTVYHDTDADRTTWQRDDGNGALPSDWGNQE